jgi:transposase
VPRIRTVDLRWNALLNDFRRSGLTQAEFCRRRQISLHSFRKHLYLPSPSQPTPSDDRSPANPDHHFLPVTILPDPIPSITASQPHLELILSNGRRIAVAPGFDPQTLRRLISVVEERPCLD